MRARTGRALLTAALVLGLTGIGPALAQFFEPAPQYYRAPPRPVGPPPQVYQAPGGGYYYVQPQQAQPAPRPRRRAEPPGYYPGMLVQPAPQPAPSYSLRRLFGLDEEDRRGAARDDRPKPKPRPVPAIAKPVKPKAEPNAVVAVFGDSLAESTGQGIADAFDDTPETDVIRKTRGDGGIARMDPAEWAKVIQETVEATPKLAAAVVMVGANERQAIREGDVSHEPLSERWRALYRDRVDAVVRAFQDKGIPLVWIGAPPVRTERVSTDLIAMNEIIRERVQRAGGTYVDIWPGFVDDENRYVDRGPDIAGQNVRLRAEGGVNFTRAGARKAAFFADAEIKRLVEAKLSGTAVATLPAPDAAAPAQPSAVPPAPAGPADPAGAPAAPQQAALPAAPAAPAVPEKPVAGPVVPLTRPETTPGGTLLSTAPRLDSGPAAAAQKTFRDGVAPTPRPGRADDFRWPKS